MVVGMIVHRRGGGMNGERDGLDESRMGGIRVDIRGDGVE